MDIVLSRFLENLLVMPQALDKVQISNLDMSILWTFLMLTAVLSLLGAPARYCGALRRTARKARVLGAFASPGNAASDVSQNSRRAFARASRDADAGLEAIPDRPLRIRTRPDRDYAARSPVGIQTRDRRARSHDWRHHLPDDLAVL